jgi:hypothetical protein
VLVNVCIGEHSEVRRGIWRGPSTITYIRDGDNALMVSTAEHCFVNADLVGVRPGDRKHRRRGHIRQSFGEAQISDYMPPLQEYRAPWAQPTFYDRAAVQEIPAASRSPTAKSPPPRVADALYLQPSV